MYDSVGAVKSLFWLFLEKTALGSPVVRIRVRERRGVQSGPRPQAAATGLGGLPRVRTALPDLLIVLPGAQHPIQPDRQFVRNGHFGRSVMLVHRQAKILPALARIVAPSLGGSLHR